MMHHICFACGRPASRFDRQIGEWVCEGNPDCAMSFGSRWVAAVSEPWRGLRNRRMAEKLSTGKALSVLIEGEAIGGGLYKLRRFVDGVDYCDPTTEEWIWSIGRNHNTREIWASTNANFYQDRDYECLFLR